MKTKHHICHRSRKHPFLLALSALVLLVMAVGAQAQTPEPTPEKLMIDSPIVIIDEPKPPIPAPSPIPVCRIVKANVVALDQLIMYNRLGTVNPAGMIFALMDDVVAIDPLERESRGQRTVAVQQTAPAYRAAHEQRRLPAD